MEGLYPHKSGLGLMEPVALVNQNVCVMYGSEEYYRKVSWFESLPPFQFLNIGAIPAQNQSGLTQALNLAWADEEFAQIRWFVIDNAQVRLWLPDADGKYRTQTMMAYVDMNTIYRDPCLHLTEFCVWENHTPWFLAINPMDYPLTQCRLIGVGYRYKVRALTAAVVNGIKAGTIPCTYVGATGRT